MFTFDVAWVLVSSRTQFQPQVIVKPYYLPDCLSVFLTMALTNVVCLRVCKLQADRRVI